MEPVTLDQLVVQGEVAITPTGLATTIHPNWVVSGENRLSYTTCVRLAECCREVHWMNDIVPYSEHVRIDSTTKSMIGNFSRPIPVGSRLLITYRVTDVRRRGYALLFRFEVEPDMQTRAEIEIICVFIDADSGAPISPPKPVHDRLVDLSKIQ